jgi:hypothetical protein
MKTLLRLGLATLTAALLMAGAAPLAFAESEMEKVGEDIEHGAEKTGDAMKEGADKVGEGAKKDWDATTYKDGEKPPDDMWHDSANPCAGSNPCSDKK